MMRACLEMYSTQTLVISNLISKKKHSVGRDELKVCVTFNSPSSNQKQFTVLASCSATGDSHITGASVKITNN